MVRRRTSEQIAVLALRNGGQRLVCVKVDRRQQSEGGFVLWLANGRRIETGWGFGDAELARLIRVAEGV